MGNSPSTFDISLPSFIPQPADLKTDAWFIINLASCILQLEKEGEKMIAIKIFQDRFSGFPLKVVYKKIQDELFVITAYPLKKRIWR